MKDSKECAKPPKPPRPNLKNKDFVKWQKSESCKREDSIVSTEWPQYLKYCGLVYSLIREIDGGHKDGEDERLKKTEPFVPAYDNKPLNMVYLLSGEYGRIWQKERDEWYAGVFVPQAKEKDMQERRAKIRRQAREAKKAAEKSIKERKERKAKEAEAKAKAEAEKAEKIKAKLQKCSAAKKSAKTTKKKEAKEEAPKETEEKQESCPKGWTPVELTLQCECSNHDKDKPSGEEKEAQLPDTKANETADNGCTMCPGYVQQLKDIQDAKTKETESEEKD